MTVDAYLSGAAPAEDSIIMGDLPIPPSSNRQYRISMRYRKTRLVKTELLTDFERALSHWELFYKQSHVKNLTKIALWKQDPHLRLQMDVYFLFEYDKLFTKLHKVKKLDTSNRIKSLHDGVCDLLGIDDSLLFRITAEKCLVKPKYSQMSIIKLFPMKELN